jgi:hypothetical protein
LVWVFHRCRLKLLPIRTGATVEKTVLVPLLLVATVVLVYLNTGARGAFDPLVSQLMHTLN